MCAKAPVSPVDAYIASRPPAVQGALKEVRRILKKAMPRAEEVISYGIPLFTQGGMRVIFLAGWARHYSLYPVGSARVLAAFRKELEPYEVSRGTIRFPLSGPIPAGLIARIARFRVREASAAKAIPRAARKR
jgi:uncharacterized protein YdhG (YjbR/CyaY superfamily)